MRHLKESRIVLKSLNSLIANDVLNVNLANDVLNVVNYLLSSASYFNPHSTLCSLWLPLTVYYLLRLMSTAFEWIFTLCRGLD